MKKEEIVLEFTDTQMSILGPALEALTSTKREMFRAEQRVRELLAMAVPEFAEKDSNLEFDPTLKCIVRRMSSEYISLYEDVNKSS